MIIASLDAGLTHDEFWSLTIYEVMLSVLAHKRRVERDQHMLAWVQSNILRGLIGKKAPSINRLLGRPSLMGRSPDQIRDHFRRKQGRR